MKIRAYLQITKACNLKCIMCDFWKNDYENFSKNHFLKIINVLVVNKIKWITFWWGEPFLNKDIYDLISYSKDKWLTTGIITNWSVLDKAKIAFIIDSLDEIIFSIDSWLPEIHENIRWKKWIFKTILDNFEFIINLRDEKNKKIKIIIDTTILKVNYNSIESILELAKKYSVKVNFDPVQIIWYWNKKNWDKLLLNEDEIFEFQFKILKLWENNQSYFVQSKDSIKRIIRYLKWYKIENYCSSLNRDLLLDPYWNVLKCWWSGDVLYNILKDWWKISNEKLRMKQYCYGCWFTHVRNEDYFDGYSITNDDFEKNIY